MIVDLGEALETRDARAGAVLGIKNIRYACDIHVFHKAWMEHAEDAGADMDLLHEAILDSIRADRTLGGALFQAGESARGIESHRPPPELDGDKTNSYLMISFDADVKIIA
jgi:hypothetical protein